MRSFRSGEPWLDTAGQRIDAHGGGFLLDGGLYHWFGSARTGHACAPQCKDGGVNLYTSPDLYHWTFRGTVITSFVGTSAAHNGLDLERPKVIKCQGRFVMWVRGTGDDNTPQLLAVATALAATGPWKWLGNASDPFHTVAPGNPNIPAGYQFADATLFADPVSGRHYVYWRTRVNPQNTGFRGMELTADCLGVRPETDTQIFQTPNREAPAVFYARERYYLWLSGCNGWNPTTTHLYTATSPLGAFNESGVTNPKGWRIGWQPPPIPEPNQPGNRRQDGEPGQWAFASQSTYILPNPLYAPGSRLAPFVYLGDRWDVFTPYFGTYVWLPLFIDDANASRVRVVWHDTWRLDNAVSPFADARAVERRRRWRGGGGDALVVEGGGVGGAVPIL